MCGLAGIYNFRSGAAPGAELLSRMAVLLRHRGPDGYGRYLDGPVGLSHARLSIVDLYTGDQPIHNEDRSVWVVFNGEIFNYVELRESLEAAGHRFYTHTDTEVLVHLYERHGEAFVDHLNGQFAIALWDGGNARLILARDRVGILPLFYRETPGGICFASEAKAILAACGSAPALDPNVLDQIMTLWTPAGRETIFSGIRQVLPGELLVVEGKGIRRRQYWDWRFPEDGRYAAGSERELAERLDELLRDATRLRLRADVPVGAYLSGGLDSSALAALIHETGCDPRTFSIGFDDEGLDEGPYQSAMVEHLGVRHSRVHCRHADIAAQFERCIWHAETPVLRSAPVPMMLLSGLVHGEGYKVVLTGEGADEVLGGYDIFKEAKIRRFWSRQPRSRIRPLLLKRLYPYLDTSPARAQSYGEAFFGAGVETPDLPQFSHLPRWNTTAGCKAFLAEEFRARIEGDAVEAAVQALPPAFGRWHPFNRAQYLEARTLMSGYLLCSQGDRMSMANSVECRFPFLDHRVVEFAGTLHPRLKMKVLNEKYLLKRAMARRLPARILQRHKQPYRAPDIPSFSGGRAPEYVRELLGEDRLRRYGYFDAKKVAFLVRKVDAGRAIGMRDNMAFMGILSTQMWHYLFVERYAANVQGAGSIS